MGLEAKILSRSGAWFYYEGEQVAQGKEKLRDILENDKKMSLELELKIRNILNMGGTERIQALLDEVIKENAIAEKAEKNATATIEANDSEAASEVKKNKKQKEAEEQGDTNFFDDDNVIAPTD